MSRDRPGSDDAALVREVAAGSQAALGELYDRHVDAVFAAASRLTADRQVAEEVVQETFLALWNRAELFDQTLGSLAAWLHTIARNRTVDRLRAAGRRPNLIPLSSAAGADEQDGAALDRLVAVRDRHRRGAPWEPGPEGELAAAELPAGAPRRARGAARRRADGDRPGLPRGTVAIGDRRAARVAARHRQDADAAGAPPAPGRRWSTSSDRAWRRCRSRSDEGSER